MSSSYTHVDCNGRSVSFDHFSFMAQVITTSSGTSLIVILAIASVQPTCCTSTGIDGEAGGMPAWGTQSWIFLGVSLALVLFAGLMSGLTMGLMSLDLNTLKVLEKSGKPDEQKHAARIIPLVSKHHLLLVTLLLWNAGAMETLPLMLDRIVSPVIAIVLSVTLVLIFGEVIPQAICTRYGLSIGANLSWLVYILIILIYPIAWPLGKMLDCILGHSSGTFFRRAELGELVSIHGAVTNSDNEEPLTRDECLIIRGALAMTGRDVVHAMTPLIHVFMVDYDGVWNRELMMDIMDRGHSRIPVYRSNRLNVVGIVLVKRLILLDPDDCVPVKDTLSNAIHEVPSTFQLYDALNLFQEGRSHLAVVRETGLPSTEGNIVGVITLEDVLEELLQEEIIDETDSIGISEPVQRRINAVRVLRRCSSKQDDVVSISDVATVRMPPDEGNGNEKRSRRRSRTYSNSKDFSVNVNVEDTRPLLEDPANGFDYEAE